MEPKVFRALLHRIVSKTIPLTAGTILLAGCQSIHIFGAGENQNAIDAGTQISSRELPERTESEQVQPELSPPEPSQPEPWKPEPNQPEPPPVEVVQPESVSPESPSSKTPKNVPSKLAGIKSMGRPWYIFLTTVFQNLSNMRNV